MGRTVKFTTNQTSEQIAYLAGIIDGEGCFYFGCVKQGKYGSGFQWHSQIKICSCDKILIDWLNWVFGGHKEQCTRYTSKRAFERDVFSWDARGPLLDYLLPKIYPYLIIKKRQCEVMVEIRKTYANIGSQRLTDSIVQKRWELLHVIRQLNSRFHNHAIKHNKEPSALSP